LRLAAEKGMLYMFYQEGGCGGRKFPSMDNKAHRRSHRVVLPDFGLADQLGIALAVFVGTYLIVAALRFSFPDSETFLFVYVPVIGGTAYLGGRRAGLVLAFLAIASAGYYRFAPAFDLTPGNLLSFGLSGLVAFLTALGPARLRDIEREAEKADQRLMLLADASALLGEAFEHETSLKHVAHLTVPGFADWCVVELVDEDATRIVALAHADSAKGSVLEVGAEGDDEGEAVAALAALVEGGFGEEA